MSQGNSFRRAAIGALLAIGGLYVQATQAAPINLTPSFPDLATFNATLSYTYVRVCERNNSSTTFGVCGTGSGQNAFNGPQHWELSYGRLRVYGNVAQALNPDGNGLLGVSDVNGTGNNYDLSVVLGFNSTGTALSGILASDPWSGDSLSTTSLGAFGSTANLDFDSGTLVTGTPTDATAYGYAYPFGYSGTDSGGVFEFVFNNVGGDFAAFGGVGGIIITTNNLTAAVGGWDSLGIGFWKANHSGTANVDTVVPVPAAAWMLGSGLMSLLGVRLSRKHKEV